MALIKCSECKKQVSDQAVACPHCGFPLKEPEKKEEKDLVEKIKDSKRLRNIFIRFGLSFILFLLIVVPLEYGINYKGAYPLLMMYSLTQNGAFFLYIIFGLIVFFNFILNLISKKLAKANKIIDIITIVFLIVINSVIVFTSGIRLTLIVYPLMYLTLILLLLLNIEKPFKEKNNRVLIIIITLLGIISSIVFATNKVDIALSKITNLSELKEGNKLFITVDTEFINVRENADKSSKKIGSVIYGEEFEVLEIVNGEYYNWYKIKDANNIEGFVANPKSGSEYLMFEKIGKNDTKIITYTTFHDATNKEENEVLDTEKIEEKTTTKKQDKNNKTTTKKKTTSKTTAPSTTKKSEVVTTTKNITTKTTTQRVTENNKAVCNQKILERTDEYEKDVKAVDEKYATKKDSAKREMENAKKLVENYGGTISKSNYTSRKNAISSELSKAQQNYQRAILGGDHYGAARYEQEIIDLTEESAELLRRYELTEQYNDMVAYYNQVLEDYKYELQKLYNQFSKDLDSIEASC